MKYYITVNGQQRGPFELNELLINGLTAQSYVWNETMTNWAPAMQVPEVAALLQPQQAQQAPPPAYGQPQPQPQPQQQAYQQQAYQQPYQQPSYGYAQPAQQMDFGQAIKVCFNKYANFEGRARRSEFWWFQLFCYLLMSVTCGIGGLVVLIPIISSTARRLHDVGKSGWLQLVQLIPFVGWIIVLVWCLQDSQPGQNQWGPNPKQ
ncbi:MAG: DUF805 domain-containing protein [Bacteroidales bacterium]|nr:DUF805 domain-containing protein [Bacteroidales bacterium]